MCRAYLPNGKRSGRYWILGATFKERWRPQPVRQTFRRWSLTMDRICCVAGYVAALRVGDCPQMAWTASTQHNFHTRFCRHGCVSINMEVQSCLKRNSSSPNCREISSGAACRAAGAISRSSQGDRRQTTDLAEMRQRSIELGAPSGAERRRQSACFRRSRPRRRTGLGRRAARCASHSVAEGEDTLRRSRE